MRRRPPKKQPARLFAEASQDASIARREACFDGSQRAFRLPATLASGLKDTSKPHKTNACLGVALRADTASTRFTACQCTCCTPEDGCGLCRIRAFD